MSVLFWMRQGRNMSSLTKIEVILNENSIFSRLYSLNSLISVCHTFMDRNATAMLVHESFRNLSQVVDVKANLSIELMLIYSVTQESLCGILKRDSFFAPEVLIFGAVSNWCKVNQATDIEVIITVTLTQSVYSSVKLQSQPNLSSEKS